MKKLWKKNCSLVLALVMCLTMLPSQEVKAAVQINEHNGTYVGDVKVDLGENVTYWKNNYEGSIVPLSDSEAAGDNYNVKYVPSSANNNQGDLLELKDAVITKSILISSYEGTKTSGIYSSSDQLELRVSGKNTVITETTITEDSISCGIYLGDTTGTCKITGTGSLMLKADKAGTISAAILCKNKDLWIGNGSDSVAVTALGGTASTSCGVYSNYIKVNTGA